MSELNDAQQKYSPLIQCDKWGISFYGNYILRCKGIKNHYRWWSQSHKVERTCQRAYSLPGNRRRCSRSRQDQTAVGTYNNWRMRSGIEVIHKDVDKRFLQLYLNEYCWKFNRRFFRDRKKEKFDLFDHLIRISAQYTSDIKWRDYEKMANAINIC